jgi:hypothetical protein
MKVCVDCLSTPLVKLSSSQIALAFCIFSSCRIPGLKRRGFGVAKGKKEAVVSVRGPA